MVVRRSIVLAVLTATAFGLAFCLPLPAQTYNPPRSYTVVVSVVANGSSYTVTDVNSPINFGGTDPNITLPRAGTWIITYRGQYDWSTATTAADLLLATQLVRRNNTPAVIRQHWHTTPTIAVATSATLGDFTVCHVYTTATAGDIIGLNTGLTVLPSAGALNVTAANLTAEFAHP